MDVKMLKITDERYPAMLREIDDPPESLWYVGDITLLQGRCVAVVGSRDATEYGIRVADDIGRILGSGGIHVVSGMAYGIDIAAHQGALGSDGSTIAVLGSGIDMERSVRKSGIFRNIMEEGLVVTEYPPGYPASRWTFPRRNRIISGLSLATCVVEAGIGSGSLITAELAAEQGRTVYAVPGNISSPMSLGTNKLIKDGAVPVITAEDILHDLGIYIKEEKEVGIDERILLSLLSAEGEMSINELAAASGKNRKEVLGIAAVLEMKGYVHTEMGKVFFV